MEGCAIILGLVVKGSWYQHLTVMIHKQLIIFNWLYLTSELTLQRGGYDSLCQNVIFTADVFTRSNRKNRSVPNNIYDGCVPFSCISPWAPLSDALAWLSEAFRWNKSVLNLIIYTCASHTITSQSVCQRKDLQPLRTSGAKILWSLKTRRCVIRRAV